ncbi:type III pantothenate kinase [Acidithiobacillus sulfuriphilus]|uniref:type III pantothenate kinase n=1 Tax=Acidithiobacillus sulfuriphilus TaxID=1867749 RepID=UPI003F602E67
MILIAIGNTHTLLAESADGKHFATLRLPTAVPDLNLLPAPWPEKLRQGPVFLGGVVPHAAQAWAQALGHQGIPMREPDPAVFQRQVLHAYTPADSLGFDRRCCLLAAALDYPHQDSIVIDAGTAVTIGLYAQGRFQGGRILPGLSMSLLALAQGTALLPDLSPDGDIPLLGNDTAASIRSGVYHMLASALQGAITQYRQCAPQAQIILTGGDAPRFLPALPPTQHIPQLLLRGFYLWAKG